MKIIELPIELLSLKFPWNITRSSARSKEIKNLPCDAENIKGALDTLQISLQFLSSVNQPAGDFIDSELTDYWDFTAENIAEMTPTFNDLNYSSLQKIVDLAYQVKSSEKMLEEMAEMWIWTTTRDIAGNSLTWIENNIDKDKDDEYINFLLKITSTYWQKIPHQLSTFLIGTSNRFSKEESISLLEEVEQNSPIPSQRELARDFKKLTIEACQAK
jgi:hypothetical protein